MKHGKSPTLKQKKFIKDKGLVPDNWLVVKDTPSIMEVVNRSSGTRRTFEKNAANQKVSKKCVQAI